MVKHKLPVAQYTELKEKPTAGLLIKVCTLQHLVEQQVMAYRVLQAEPAQKIMASMEMLMEGPVLIMAFMEQPGVQEHTMQAIFKATSV